MKSVLTIAGSDPTGGAGLQADLKVFRAFGVHGLSVPVALTAQNTSGVGRILAVERDFFLAQIDLLLDDITPDAVKTGMLYSKKIVEVVGDRIRKNSLNNLVIDPVTVSSSGTSLVEEDTLDLIRDVLFPLSKVITPNIYEASVLTGVHIEDEKDMEKAAIRLKETGSGVVIITGGHLERLTMDLYFDGNIFHKLEGSKINGEHHGTGCVFSAAIAACLSLGHTPLDAAKKAKEFVTEAIKKSYHMGKGMGLLNV
ncbi:MAG TPA: bifunctional hydroxymethylpyrimidine kinase/phosphomethylpyrimidine kinase [Thermodesulfovibrionales bacterium]|nr:bifunctional hydroxymethylpyrimidine kinase/phosphomethylpyrimidine kinase [Thermodesulfovibrionales bacterium]